MPKLIAAANDPSITFIVDDEDYALVSPYRWDAKPKGYAHCWELMKPMHALVGETMGITGLIDHINGIKTDNRRENLRPATKAQNGANTGPTKRNTSGYRGVQRQYGRWVVMMAVDGKATWIGSFDTAKEAGVAYDIKAREVYGEYAHRNVPDASPELIDRVKQRMMAPKQRAGSSRYRGVSLDRSLPDRQWRAQIRHQGVTHRLGRYATEEEAARVVDEKVMELGLNRRLNLPR